MIIQCLLGSYPPLSFFSDNDAEDVLTTVLWSEIVDISFLINGTAYSVGLDFKLPLSVCIVFYLEVYKSKWVDMLYQ